MDDLFWSELDTLLAWADREAVAAFSFRLREMWGTPARSTAWTAYGARRPKGRSFATWGPATYSMNSPWHGEWFPVQLLGTAGVRPIPYNLYHLKMIDQRDRMARQLRYKSLDPDNSFQSIGYDYLTDEQGLELEAIPPRHGYRGIPE